MLLTTTYNSTVHTEHIVAF